MTDATRFHVWSYAHLPLYLGIAGFRVGRAGAAVALSLAAIGRARARRTTAI